MKSVADMQEYIRSRTTRELEAEFEIYKALYHQGLTDIFTELLAMELDSRTEQDE
jgi:hypothetical protein